MIGRSRASRLAGPALAGATLGLFGLIVEGGARFVAWRLNARAVPARSVLRYSPDYGWDKAPGEEAWLDNGETRVLLRVNAHGLRGPDRPYEKPPGTRRVLLLGDSFCEGASASDEESVRGVLESLLAGRDQRTADTGTPRAYPGTEGSSRVDTGSVESTGSLVEVLNAGTSGWGTDQAMLYFEREGLRYSPDEVVLLVFGNDLADNMGQRKKPWFALEDGRLVPRNSPPPEPPEGRGRRAADPEKRLTSWHGSMALRLLGLRTETSRPALHRRLASLGLVPRLEDHAPTRAWLQSYGPDTDETRARWAVFEALLARLRDNVSAAGGTPHGAGRARQLRGGPSRLGAHPRTLGARRTRVGSRPRVPGRRPCLPAPRHSEGGPATGPSSGGFTHLPHGRPALERHRPAHLGRGPRSGPRRARHGTAVRATQLRPCTMVTAKVRCARSAIVGRVARR